MNTATILDLVKARLGVSTTVRDTYLTKIVESVQSELTNEKGIDVDLSDANHLMFIVDYSSWRYQSRDSTGAMPEHLKWRLKNLYVSGGKDV